MYINIFIISEPLPGIKASALWPFRTAFAAPDARPFFRKACIFLS